MERKLGWIVMAMLALTMVVVGACGGFGDVADDELGEGAAALIDVVGGRAGVPVKVRYLGVGGVEFEFDDQIFLVDPYLTRTVNDEPPAGFLWYVYPGAQAAWGTDNCSPKSTAQESWDLLDEYLDGLKSPISHMFVTHTHWDHAADVPLLAKRLGGAWNGTIWGTTSMMNLAKAHDSCSSPNETQLEPSVQTITPSNLGVGLGSGSPKAVYVSPDGNRRVEVIAYSWEHSGNDKLEGDIDPAICPTVMKMQDYRQGEMLAYFFRFVDNGRTFTAFVGAAAYDSTDTVQPLLNLNAALGGPANPGIDALFVTITDWYKGPGDSEEQNAIDDMMWLLEPRFVVPMHFDDYYWPIKNTTVQSTTNSDWKACSFKPAVSDSDYHLPHLVFTMAQLDELQNMQSGIVDRGKKFNVTTTVKLPKLFETVLTPGPASATMLALRSSTKPAADKTPICINQVGATVGLGSCVASTNKSNRWGFEVETSGRLRNLATNLCLNRSMTSDALVFQFCGVGADTRWTFSDVSGMIYTTVSNTKRCLYDTGNNTVGLTSSCDPNSDSQRWVAWTVTHIDQRSQPQMTFARANSTIYSNDPVVMKEWTSTGSYDRTAFIYEPATGLLRVADNPRYCLQLEDNSTAPGNPLVLRLCYSGTPQQKMWRYDASGSYEGRIRPTYNTNMCLRKVTAPPENIILDTCGQLGDSVESWRLQPSRGVPVGKVYGYIMDAVTSANISGAQVQVSGSDCLLTTDSSGKYTCNAVSTGTQTVTVVSAPCPYFGNSASTTVVRDGTKIRNVYLQRKTAKVSGIVQTGVLGNMVPLTGVLVQTSTGQSTTSSSTVKPLAPLGFYSVGGIPVASTPTTVTVTYSKPGYYTKNYSTTVSCSSLSKTINAILTPTGTLPPPK